MKNETLPRKIYDEMTECHKEWQEWLTEAQEDAEFAAGEQWKEADKARLASQSRPALVLNMILKHFSVLTGYEKQNRSDVKAYPVESNDQTVADIYSQLLSWILDDSGGKFAISEAFENAALTGLGWIHPKISYDDDVIDGDIQLESESPFRVLPDSQFAKADLSDCKAIFRHAYLTKDECKNLFPDYDDEIDALQGGGASIFSALKHKSIDKDRLNVVEKWSRKSVKKTFIVDSATGEVNEYDGDKKSLKRLKETIELAQVPEVADEELAAYANLKIIERQASDIKLTVTIEDALVVYDGGHPHNLKRYPFIPIFGYFFPILKKPELRHFGTVRILKDAQREKNKRRSQILEAVLKMIFGGWKYESGAVADPSVLTQSGAGKNIEIAPGKKIDQIDPPPVPASLIQLEQMHSVDMREIGMNPDLLGMMQSANEPGITTQLRQKQGIVAVQNIFDRLSESKKNLGKYLISMIDECFSDEKILRITGLPELPESWHKRTRFDTIVEESAVSPTYRMANFMVLTEMIKSGLLPMTPEIAIAWIEGSELPQGTKDAIIESVTKQQQLQEQQQAAQQQAAPQGQPQGQPMPSEMPPDEIQRRAVLEQ